MPCSWAAASPRAIWTVSSTARFGGSVITPAGLFISGRELTDDQPNASLLAFKRELSGLEGTLAALDEQIAVARSIAEEDGRELASLEEKTVDLQSLIIKVERGLHGLDIQRSTTRQEIERAERHKKVVADEQRQTHEEIEQNKARIAEAAESRRTAEQYRDEAKSEVDRINSQLTDARAKSEEENAVVNEKRTLAATSGERRRSVHATLKRVENEQKELEARSAIQTVELTEIDVKIAALRESTAAIADRIAGAETEKSAESEELMVTQGTRIEMLRAGLPPPTRFGLVLILDRRLANVPLIRFKVLQAEKHLL